jgi:ssDNA-binding Zn-finger/Zn-ribbon topoisomerase 1
MVLLLAKKEAYVGNYFWGCSSYPGCRNLEPTLLKKLIPYAREKLLDPKKSSYLHKSSEMINPTDKPTDNERHSAISKKFRHDHKFLNSDIKGLDTLLGFENQNDFFFWVCATQHYHSGLYWHNHISVGSPYIGLFINLTEYINNEFDNILLDLLKTKRNLMPEPNTGWRYFLALEEEAALHKKEKTSEKEEEGRLAAVNRRSIKATENIFNAIRRKDYKAILAFRIKGADLQYKNDSELTPLEYAESFKDKLLIEALTNEIEE